MPNPVAKVSLTRSKAVSLASTAAIIVIAGLIGAGCGTDDAKQALDPVAKAAEVTAKQSRGTAMTLKGTMTVNDEEASFTGEGVFDNDETGNLVMTVKAAGDEVEIHEVLDGNVIYMRSDAFDDLPDGKHWLKVDLQAAAKKEGLDLEALTGGSPQSPEDGLDYLKAAGDSEKIGTETIDGIPTTRYHVDVDLRKVAEESDSPNASKTVEKLIDMLGTDTMPIDVWIDGKNRVRREHFKIKASADGEEQTMDMTMNLTRFNVPMRIKTPAADDTVDALKLIEEASN